MAKRKKITPYRKQITRIEKYITKLVKEGYTPTLNQKLYTVDKETGEIHVRAKSLEKAKQLTSKEIRKSFEYYNPVTDTYETVNERRKRERKEQERQPKKKPPKEDALFSLVQIIYDKINEIPDVRYVRKDGYINTGELRQSLMDVFQGALDDADNEGKQHEYLAYLQTVKTEIFDHLYTVSHDSSSAANVYHNYNRCAELLKGMPLSMDEKRNLEEPDNYDEEYDEV